MNRTRLFAAAALAVSAAFAALPAQSETVGKVQLLHVYGYETPPGAAREALYVRDDVVADTEIESVRDGRIDVRFVDGTQLIVGPETKIKIDRFVYDPDKTAGEMSLNITRGVMRFVTGRMASKSYRIQTPTATLGIRGTDVVVAVADDGATDAFVIDGGVDVTSSGGDAGDVSAGSTAATAGGPVSVAPTIGVPPLSQIVFGTSPEATDPEQNDEEPEDDHED